MRNVRYSRPSASWCSQVKVLIFIVFGESPAFGKVGKLYSLAMNQFRFIGFVLILSEDRSFLEALFLERCGRTKKMVKLLELQR